MNRLISKQVIELLTYRIQQEEESSRLYEQMSLFLNDRGYTNFSKLYKKYANEELNHAQWAKDYILSFGELPQLEDLDKQEISYKSLPDILRATLEHEIVIAEQCKALAAKAFELQDFMLFSLAQKYNYEQIEEIEKAQSFVDKLETFGESKEVLLLLEHNLEI